MTHSITFGSVGFQSSEVDIIHAPRVLNRLGVGLAVDRTQREGDQPYIISDLAGGLIAETNDIRGIELSNRSTYSEGCVTRIPNFIGLPEVVQNQAAITSDEDISGGVAAGWHVHVVTTALGSSTGAKTYIFFGHKMYQVNTSTGALSVLDTFTNVVTDAAVIKVNSAYVLAVATNGATDDIKYTADPDGASPSWTLLVALSSGDYITGMQFYEQMGPVGATCIVGQVGGTNGMWWKAGDEAATWTLEELVDADTADQDNTDASLTTTGPLSPGWVSYDDTDRVSSGASTTDFIVNNPGNTLASDDTDATFVVDTDSAVGDHTGSLYWSGWNVSAIPRHAFVPGVHFEIERSEPASTNQVFDFDLRLLVNGSAVGIPRPSATEYPTSDAYEEYGDTDDDGDDSWGVVLRGSDLRQLVVRYQAGIVVSAPTGSGTITIDHARISFTWRVPGFSPSLPTGGFRINRDATKPNRMTVVTPRTDEEGAVTQEREVWFLDFTWNASQGRPVVTLSQPNEGAPHVEVAEPFLGGTLMATALKPGPGTDLKHYTSSNQLLDYDFPKKYGANFPYIVWLLPSGSACAIGVVLKNSSGTVVDFQVWFMVQVGQVFRYFADTPLTSLTDNGGSNMTIDAEPLRFATIAQDPQTSHIFTVYPQNISSTEETVVRREKMHTNLYADPRQDNPAWTKQFAFSSGTEDTAMKVRMPRINFGPEDAQTALNEMILISDQVDDGTSYGSVEWEVDTGGDTSLASPEAQNTWSSATLTPYKVATAGIAYDSMILQAKLTGSAGSANTPNAAGLQLTTTQRLARRSLYRVRTNRSMLGDYNSILTFLDALDDASASKVTQILRIEIDGVESTYEGQVVATWERPENLGGRLAGPLDVTTDDDFYLFFAKAAGKVGS